MNGREIKSKIEFLFLIKIVRRFPYLFRVLGLPYSVTTLAMLKPKSVPAASNKEEDYENFVLGLSVKNKRESYRNVMKQIELREKERDREQFVLRKENFINEVRRIDLSDEMVNEHRTFLLQVFNHERERQANIDQKLYQILVQTSLVGVLISTMMTFFYDKIIRAFNGYTYLLFLGVVIFVLGFYFLVRSILIALRAANVKGYQRLLPSLIFDYPGKDVSQFIMNQAVLLQGACMYNIDVNNSKAEGVEKSFRFFGWGLTSLLIFNIFYLAQMLFNPNMNTVQDVKLTNPPLPLDITPLNKSLERQEDVGNSIRDALKNIEEAIRLQDKKTKINRGAL